MNEVALGKWKDFYEFDQSLSKPPDGYDSTHGVRSDGDVASTFKDDEYVVYDTAQQRIRFLNFPIGMPSTTCLIVESYILAD